MEVLSEGDKSEEPFEEAPIMTYHREISQQYQLKNGMTAKSASCHPEVRRGISVALRNRVTTEIPRRTSE